MAITPDRPDMSVLGEFPYASTPEEFFTAEMPASSPDTVGYLIGLSLADVDPEKVQDLCAGLCDSTTGHAPQIADEISDFLTQF